MKKIYKSASLIFTIIFVSCINFGFAQNNTAAFAAADTTRFSVDLNGGWQIFNSYVNKKGSDSSVIELIVQHNNNLNWYQPQYIGKIKYNPSKPAANRNVQFTVSNRVYRLQIKKNGKCFVNFVSGTTPSGSPVVIPLKATYKL